MIMEGSPITGPKIIIDLEAIFGSNEEFTLRDAIIQEAATQIVNDVREEAREAIRERVARVDEIAKTEVIAVVREVMAQPIQRRSAWGEKLGETTTVLEIAREHMTAFFERPQRRDQYTGRTEGPVNLSGLIEEAVKEALAGEFKQVVQEARKQVAGRVTDVVTKALAVELTKGR
jgi:hypothetical protein